MPVRLGFVGCGSHARTNLYPCLRFADCELVAVADLYESHRAYCVRHFGARRAYADYRELLSAERELDAVIVCGPAELHHAATLAAVERGLPVLVEKPPAPDLTRTLELSAAAKAAGKPVMVALMKRFAPKYVQAKAIASDPAFGPVTACHLRYSYRVAMDPGRTAALMGIHAIDLMRFFMGDPMRVTVERGEHAGHHSFALLYAYANGSVGTLVMNAAAPFVTERLELTGMGASVVVDEVATLTHYAAERQGVWKPGVGEVHVPNFALQTVENDSHVLQGYAGEVMEFVSSVAEGRPPRTATLEDALEAMRVVELLGEHASGAFSWPLAGRGG